MSLFLTMLPYYLLGNFHCFGMCGPIAMMIGKHMHAPFYFIGRILGFALGGFIAATFGTLLVEALSPLHLGPLFCFSIGTLMMAIGISYLGMPILPFTDWIQKSLAPLNQKMSLLLLKNSKWPTFLFGFSTLLLPCGQSMVVFAACALSQEPLTGFLNGWAFACLTTPALLLATKAHFFLKKIKRQADQWMALLSLAAGGLAWLRGFADLEWIPHFSIKLESLPSLHLVIY